MKEIIYEILPNKFQATNIFLIIVPYMRWGRRKRGKLERNNLIYYCYSIYFVWGAENTGYGIVNKYLLFSWSKSWDKKNINNKD